ncbi:DUF4126 domain-containing protein [Pandoraea apista]|uniref:DUF4126 domain-containing protein n=1 Tax=Pandoraea apista TaxID=93218 RepID=A0A5E5P738_9BURK|nr:DUF4126 domain-containing protein [Pandoraea apista]AJF01285.1 membrane protein [Pandoraea apista]AKH75540.1 membrane protein [Pandoraea apista]AKI64895.1 membrane protein [Pandoraea apista]ALS67891.1 hypothetical protein AT395_06810 [Pandoraea apista]OXS92206.1 hypothetical protein B7H01_18035 [Pandoraea apista]
MLESIALGAGLSWGSGLRLYLTVFCAGLAARLGWLHLPPSLMVLTSTWVIATAGVLTAIEFFADKIPFVDSAWDAVHTFIRIPAGIVLGAAALGQMDPTVTVLAGLAGGALAGTAHLAKAGSRALINTSPEPFSNVAASAGEDISTVGGLALAFFLPAVFLVMLLVFVVLAWWWLPRVWRGWRSVLARVKGLRNDGVH